MAGFSLHKDRLTLEALDGLAVATGLELIDRWGTWDRRVFTSASDYAVSVYRKI